MDQTAAARREGSQDGIERRFLARGWRQRLSRDDAHGHGDTAFRRSGHGQRPASAGSRRRARLQGRRPAAAGAARLRRCRRSRLRRERTGCRRALRSPSRARWTSVWATTTVSTSAPRSPAPDPSSPCCSPPPAITSSATSSSASCGARGLIRKTTRLVDTDLGQFWPRPGQQPGSDQPGIRSARKGSRQDV